MNRIIILSVFATLSVSSFGLVERERPELNEATKLLISAYRRNPTDANYAALRKQVAANYDAVIARKKGKLASLKEEGVRGSLVASMEEIVAEVVADRENRIEMSMRRFTDPRMRPGCREAQDGFHVVLGAAEAIDIAHTPVTNAEFNEWNRRRFPKGQENFPAVKVTLAEAKDYCAWLTKRDPNYVYRLPTAEEWELAAGHMPKDADFNNGTGGLSPVTAYEGTLAACGAIDMWGNCWEWTTTGIGARMCEVKGGAWDEKRTACRTEERATGRSPSRRYPNVGFRVVRVAK